MIVYFPHIPKAGGTTLLHGFYEAFGSKKCLKVWNPKFGADVNPEQFLKLGKSDFENIGAVVGHLKLSDFLKNDHARNEFEEGNVKIITSVRDPIKRILSLYNYVSLNKNHPFHDTMRKKSLAQFIRGQAANFQFNFLKPDEEATVESLFEIMRIVPIEHSVEYFSAFFEENFKVRINDMKIKNKSTDWANGQKTITTDDIGEEGHAFLIEKHQIDFELYQAAMKGFD